MKEVTKEKTMTTREIADVLGISAETVRLNGKALFPQKNIENGKITLWTESEAKMILEKVRANNAGSAATSKGALEVITSDITPSFTVSRLLVQAQEQADKSINAQMQIAKAGMEALAKAIALLQNENADLKRDLDDSDKYTSLLKYCAEHSLPTDMQTIRSEARKIRKAMTQANRLDDIKKIPDSRYPNGVNSYPVDFLDLYFSEGEM